MIDEIALNNILKNLIREMLLGVRYEFKYKHTTDALVALETAIENLKKDNEYYSRLKLYGL